VGDERAAVVADRRRFLADGPRAGLVVDLTQRGVVAVRLDGLDQVLQVGWRMARPGRVRVAFGAPLRLVGDDYEALARQVETAVKAL